LIRILRAFLVASAVILACAAGEASIREQQAVLLKNLETLFIKRDLGSFQNPGGKKVSILIVHSLIEPPKGIEQARFRSFKQIEQWLRSHERFHDESINEHHPFREVRKGQFSGPDRYEYDNMGINHNTWYLSQVDFTQTNGRVTISKIVIYDGD